MFFSYGSGGRLILSFRRPVMCPVMSYIVTAVLAS